MKFKQTTLAKLLKPLFQLKKVGSSANRYRKHFQYLVREKGSIGKGYQAVRREVKANGIRSAKNLLKLYQKHGVYEPHILAPIQPVQQVNMVQNIFDMQQNEYSADELLEMLAKLKNQPLISIVMPVYNTPSKWLVRVIESLQEQIYENWELCVVDDCSPSEAPRRLLTRFAAEDKRIRFQVTKKNGGISAASNLALDMARGEFIALLDHDDEITPDALFWFIKTINDEPEADFIYSDECKIDDTPERKLFHLVAKPDWSPEIMLNGMITGHFTAYKTDLVRQVGGFRSEYDFSQDYDLALRISRVAKKVVHIERILYLWRAISGSAASGDKPYARLSNIAALQDHINELGVSAFAHPLLHANCVQMLPEKEDKVSIVIPSDSYENLKKAIDGVLICTSYRDYEIVAVCNSPLADKLEKEYAGCLKLKFSRYDKKYNFSDKCNQGARDSLGKFVVFYNDDVFPIQSDWLHKLVEYLYLPNVGAVSPKLLYENDTIQYAGMISGTPGLCGTAYNHYGRNQYDDYLSMNQYVRNVSILSGACCIIDKELFNKVGRFDAINTPDGHSDVDLSYKILEAGYRCVYTPYSELYHIGNHSWGNKKDKYKADIFCLKNWGKYISTDPYFTDTMKKVLYHDFVFKYKIYAQHIEPNQKYTGQDVLFISHELSHTGAPHMLYYAALAVKNSGGFPVVVAPQDGPLRQKLIDAGIVVIIDESITYDHFLFKGFAKNFDKVVVNTAALAQTVRSLATIKNLDVVWWLHESKMLPEFLKGYDDLADTNTQIVCVSQYARSFLPKIFDANILSNGIPDNASKYSQLVKPENEPLTFVLLGTIEERKGQDIFCKAIALLPEQVRQNCQFFMAGKLWAKYESFFAECESLIKKAKNVQYKGALNAVDSLSLLAQSDVLVCCSRDDPFSLVCMEAAMLGKGIILNQNVGVSEVLTEYKNCLIHETGNPESLAKQMIFAYENQDKMKQFGQNAREVFETKLSLDKFEQAFLSLLK